MADTKRLINPIPFNGAASIDAEIKEHYIKAVEYFYSLSSVDVPNDLEAAFGLLKTKSEENGILTDLNILAFDLSIFFIEEFFLTHEISKSDKMYYLSCFYLKLLDVQFETKDLHVALDELDQVGLNEFITRYILDAISEVSFWFNDFDNSAVQSGFGLEIVSAKVFFASYSELIEDNIFDHIFTLLEGLAELYSVIRLFPKPVGKNYFGKGKIFRVYERTATIVFQNNDNVPRSSKSRARSKVNHPAGSHLNLMGM